MFNVLGDINWIPVLVGWLIFTALGGVWFGALVPAAYNMSLGRAKDAPPKKDPIFFIGPAACTLVISIATAIVMHALRIETVGDALLFALLAGVGYLVANTTNIAINPVFARPMLYALLSSVWNLAGITIVSILIVVFS